MHARNSTPWHCIIGPKESGTIYVRGCDGPEEGVYHFVYHRDRQLLLASVSTILEQKRNLLI